MQSTEKVKWLHMGGEDKLGFGVNSEQERDLQAHGGTLTTDTNTMMIKPPS